MRLVFLGTRAKIEARSRRHRRHSALLVTDDGSRVMIDCGADWLGRIADVEPNAIVLTHAHPDHAFGLADGAPCPVWATAATWEALGDYPIAERRRLEPERPARIGALSVTAFPVVHSVLAPAVGLRLAGRGAALFYVPDVVAIRDRAAALGGIDLYVGDGSTMTRPMVRRHGTALFGHTTIRAQLGWCRDEGVQRALFTHCGSEIVNGDERRLGPKLRAMGRERGVDARFAHDGLEVDLPDA